MLCFQRKKKGLLIYNNLRTCTGWCNSTPVSISITKSEWISCYLKSKMANVFCCCSHFGSLWICYIPIGNIWKRLTNYKNVRSCRYSNCLSIFKKGRQIFIALELQVSTTHFLSNLVYIAIMQSCLPVQVALLMVHVLLV